MFYLIITTKNIELKMHKIKDYIFINIIYYTDFTILSMFSCYFIIGKT
jgi:dynactin complex subunit